MLTAHSLLLQEMDDELQQKQGIPLTSYDVLLHLSEAPAAQLRMSDLAERVLLTRSGLTRVVNVLEQQGLVERVRADGDARGFYAHLTRAGRAKLKSANRDHLRSVHSRFIDRLSEDQIRTLAEVWSLVTPERGYANGGHGC